MRVEFPYPDVPALDVPAANLLGVCAPRPIEPAAPAEAIVRAALANPSGSPPLRDLARGRRRVLILVDDNTRPTPAALILPWLLAELEHSPDRPEIRFLIASGTHRPMTVSEKEAKLGAEICRRYEVLDHLWDSPAELVNLGQTSSGLPVWVNRQVRAADLLIGLGQVAPHRIAGFGGGSKIVQPGICGAATTGQTHWAAALLPGADLLGRVANPVRAEMDQVAALAGLAFVVNVVLNAANQVVGCFAGAPAAAHRAAARLAAEVYGVPIPGLADIVVIESYPGDLDMWQATKAVAAAELAVRPGGVMILITPCPEGVSAAHPAVLELGYQAPECVFEWVRRGELTDLVVAAELAITGRVVRERAHGIMVCPNIPAAETRRLGLAPAATPQEALELAFRRLGPDAGVLVLRHGGEILPLTPA